MYKFSIISTSVVLFGLVLSVFAEDDGIIEDDNRPVLKPAELADLVLRERSKHELQRAKQCKKRDHIVPSTTDEEDENILPYKIEESQDDDELLKNRKVWSRWSKWGECSASCGTGLMVRQRACVAGRCAPGELEEQRRPCRHRTPCPALTFLSSGSSNQRSPLEDSR